MIRFRTARLAVSLGLTLLSLAGLAGCAGQANRAEGAAVVVADTHSVAPEVTQSPQTPQASPTAATTPTAAATTLPAAVQTPAAKSASPAAKETKATTATTATKAAKPATTAAKAATTPKATTAPQATTAAAPATPYAETQAAKYGVRITWDISICKTVMASANGCTRSDLLNVIYVNPSYRGRSDWTVTRLVLHETAHALVYRACPNWGPYDQRAEQIGNAYAELYLGAGAYSGRHGGPTEAGDYALARKIHAGSCPA